MFYFISFNISQLFLAPYTYHILVAMAKAIDTYYNFIVEHINNEALNRFQKSPETGLFFNKAMTQSVRSIESNCVAHGNLLVALFSVKKNHKRRDLENALRKFDDLYSTKIFCEDENEDHSYRNQSAGLRMMINRVRRKSDNMKSGAKCEANMMKIVKAWRLAPPDNSPRSSPDSSPERYMHLGFIIYLFKP